MKAPTELVFSYSERQNDVVRWAARGRVLRSKPDALPGHELSPRLQVETFAEAGAARSPVEVGSAMPHEHLTGTVFALTTNELERCDAFESRDSQRIRVTLASGNRAWMYVPAPRRPQRLVIIDA